MGTWGGPRKSFFVLCLVAFRISDTGGGACVCRYRYQLEAFIDKVRGRTPEHWYDAQDSITNMQWIEAIYEEVGPAVLSFVPSFFPVVSIFHKGSFYFLLMSPFPSPRLDWDHVRHRRPRFHK
jgi:hypothetical protein